MGDTIYIPSNRLSYDFPPICLKDLMPNEESDAARDKKMIELAEMVDRWLYINTSFRGHIQWINQLDRDFNPDGDIGFYRLFGPRPSEAH